MSNTIEILIPLYNDASKLEHFFKEVKNFSWPKQYNYGFIFVDDGSRDNTVKEFEAGFDSPFPITLIRLSRNFGKESALSAGLRESTADAVICMDVDLQDPLLLIPQFLEKWEYGLTDVVVGSRLKNSGEQNWRRVFSRLYLKGLRKISGMDIDITVGETRLMDRRVVLAFNEFSESIRFVRGLFFWMGYQVEKIEYSRMESQEKSRFSIRRLIALGLEGIFSFSNVPLRLSTMLGFLIASFTVLLSFVLTFLRIYRVVDLPGYTSTMLVMLLLSSVQLIMLGIIGEYVGRTLIEAKRRPAYLIRNIQNFES